MIGIKDQYFGTEIEMTGITRQRAAEVVAEMFGTEAYYDGTTYGVWSVIDLEGKKWGRAVLKVRVYREKEDT